MDVVTLSPKYQIVIPKKVRATLRLRRGIKFRVIPYEGKLELIPLEPIKNMRGKLRGIDTTIRREKDRLS